MLQTLDTITASLLCVALLLGAAFAIGFLFASIYHPYRHDRHSRDDDSDTDDQG